MNIQLEKQAEDFAVLYPKLEFLGIREDGITLRAFCRQALLADRPAHASADLGGPQPGDPRRPDSPDLRRDPALEDPAGSH